MRHGGKILADQLKLLGVERVFSVPGESFLAALDGLYESGIANIVCRHEGGAAMMAEAQGKLSGQPGVAFVTRGPGASNASAGLHVAQQDSTPMVLFVGQIARDQRDREAFQEVDYRSMFGGFVKWVAEVDQTERLPEYIRRAFATAMAGRPGPVVLALPEDMLSAQATVPDISASPHPEVSDLASPARRLRDWICAADRPMVVVGGPHWSQEAATALADFAHAHDLPVALSFRRQDYLDNRHPCYAGDLNVGPNPALTKRMREADRLLVLGARLSDTATAGFTSVNPLSQSQEIAHVHPDPNVPQSVFGATLSVVATAPDMVSALAALPPAQTPSSDWRKAARAAYLAWSTPKESPGRVKQEDVVRHLSETLPEDAILTNGAGNYAAWLHRYFTYKGFRTQLAPTSGSMGYGFPAAIAASIAYPNRTVVCFAGDGCFQMTLNEMSTAMQFGAKPIVLVMNNGRYGTIRMHQEKTYPGRVSGTDLSNPDFAALALAYGAHGERVTDGSGFATAFERAQAADRLAVIELVLDADALSTTQSLSDLRSTQATS